MAASVPEPETDSGALPGGLSLGNTPRAPMKQERERDFLTWAAATLVYAATAISDFVLPLGKRFGEGLLGTALFAPDSILNAGILEWGYRSLWSPKRHIFEWTAGFPVHDSLATTENLIGWQIFYTPLRLASCGPVAAYNLLLVISFVLSGLGGAILARRLGADRLGAVIAGFVFAFVPFHLNHVIHIQTMAVCYCPFALFFLDRFLAEATVKNAIGLAAASLMTALSGVYFGLFLVLVLPLYAVLCWLLGRYHFHARTVEGLLGIGVACAVLLLPVVLPYVRFGSEHGHNHPQSTLVTLSLEALAPFTVPQWLAFWSHGPFKLGWGQTPAFPGVVASILALVFLIKRHSERQASQVKVALVILAFACFSLSLGPVLKIHAGYPSRFANWFPLPGRIFMSFSAIRWPMRILLFSFLFGALLAGLGFSALTRRLAPRMRVAAASLMLLLLFVEYRPKASYAAESVDIPPPLAMSDAYPFLAAEIDRGGVVELPDARPDGYRVPYLVQYAYGSAGHLRRVVDFHGAVYPAIVDNLLAAAERLPSEPARRTLVAWGVTRVVLHREPGFVDPWPLRRNAFVEAGYRVLYESRGATVFALDVAPNSSSRTVAPLSADR